LPYGDSTITRNPVYTTPGHHPNMPLPPANYEPQPPLPPQTKNDYTRIHSAGSRNRVDDVNLNLENENNRVKVGCNNHNKS